MQCLGDVLEERIDRHDPMRRAAARHLTRVLDQLMFEAVDAATTSLAVEARTDPLTGCGNRRALHEELAAAVASARRSSLDLAVAVVGLDGLKHVNGSRGHDAHDARDARDAGDGRDAELLALVSVLRRTLRRADTLYRVGGDEFVVVAPFTDEVGARELILGALTLEGPSFSWGVTSLAAGGPSAVADPDRLFVLADADLYMRRRDFRHAVAAGARRRHMMVVGSIAASVALLAGTAVALTGNAGPQGGAAPSSQALASGPLPHRHPSATTTVPSGASGSPAAAPASVPSASSVPAGSGGAAGASGAASSAPAQAAPAPTTPGKAPSSPSTPSTPVNIVTVSYVTPSTPTQAPSAAPPTATVPTAGAGPGPGHVPGGATTTPKPTPGRATTTPRPTPPGLTHLPHSPSSEMSATPGKAPRHGGPRGTAAHGHRG